MGRVVRFAGRPAVVGVIVRGRVEASKICGLAIRGYSGLGRGFGRVRGKAMLRGKPLSYA